MAFKVLIVGGSVTGLTLAAILERYGIDYTLIEKHADVAPKMGASIGLLAHGSRVLDQLGCFDELLPFGAAAEEFTMYGPDGKHLGTHQRLGANLEAMLGYPIFFVERRRVLQSLWGAIKDKSKIHLSTKVAKIELIAGGAHVETQDGRVFTGDILVGGDGIKSRTRHEMWRLMEADNHSTVADRKAIRNNCSCIFGISYGLPQVKATQTWKHFRKDRHYLCSGAPNGLAFWFLFFKTRKDAESWEHLRYTEQEKKDYAAEFASDQVRSDLTFGEMYRASKSTVLVPVEEFVLRRYYYKRIVLLGDSAHKMHPVTGQGGNSAIEDSAFLANRLKDLLQTTQNPTESGIESIFHHLQEERRPRTQILTDGARGLAHMESFGTPLLKLIMLYLFPRVPGENILASIGESMTQGEPLKYLPLPARSKRLLPYDEEVQATPRYRSIAASYAWICLFIFTGSMRFILPAILPNEVPSLTPEGPARPRFLHSWNRYIEYTYFAITAFWTIESYRSAFSLGPILTPIPWIVLAQYYGWEVVLPFYFAFWVLGSSFRGFYHPWPRAILPAAARALPMAVCFAVAKREAFIRFRILTSMTNPTIPHLLIPIVTTLVEWCIVRVHGRRWEPVYQFSDYDIKYLDQFFSCSVVPAFGHVIMLFFDIIPDLRQGYGPLLLREPEILNFGIFTVLIATWLLFTAWDLRRVRVLNLNLVTVSFYVILGMIFLGPGATLMGAWWWREKLWEKSRQRLSEERYAKVEREQVPPIIKT